MRLRRKTVSAADSSDTMSRPERPRTGRSKVPVPRPASVRDGAACGCGSVGCWETEVGEEALLRRAGLPVSMGRSGVDQVLRDADAGSGTALKALDEVGRWLGIGIAGLVNLFNPRLVVLGGSFGRIHPFISSRLERELDRRSLPGSRDLVRVVPARLGLDAPLLGAAELAFEPLLADPATWLGPREPVLAYAGA